MATKELPSPELLRKLLRYEPETGKLYWRERPAELFKTDADRRKWNTRYAGKEAFTAVSAQGYHVGRIFDVRYSAHRVIIAMTDGTWPHWVDHDNKNGTDNRRKNLVPCTPRYNQRNLKQRSDNRSGVCGVRRIPNGKWEAYINNNDGKRINLGRFNDKDEAIAVRRKAEKEFGYHPNHGKSLS